MQFRHYLIAIVLALPLLAIFIYLGSPEDVTTPDNDSALFWRIAVNLVEQQSFSGAVEAPYHFSAVRPMLYALIIALLWWLSGWDWELWIRLLQSFAHLATLLLVAHAASHLARDRRTQMGVVAAVVAAASPQLAAYTQVLLTETFATLLVTLLLWSAVIPLRSLWPRILLIGLFSGLLILLRPTFLLLPPLIVFLALSLGRVSRWGLIKLASGSALVCLLLLSPWMWLNLQQGGTPTPTRLAGVGYNLWTGVRDAPAPLGMELLDRREHTESEHESIPLTELLSRLDAGELSLFVDGKLPPHYWLARLEAYHTYRSSWSERPPPAESVIAADRFLIHLVTQWIEAHPADYARLIAHNAGTMLFGHFHTPRFENAAPPSISAYWDLYRYSLYLLCLLGVVLLWQRRQWHLLLTGSVIPLYLLVIHSPMHVEGRYFLEAFPSLAMIAAFALLALPSLGGASLLWWRRHFRLWR